MARTEYRFAVNVDLYLSVAAEGEDEARAILRELLQDGVTWDTGPFEGHLPALYTAPDALTEATIEDEMEVD